MQTVKVNNKIFRSIAKAAKYLGVQRANLSVLLKNNNQIRLKDSIVEKSEDKPVKKLKQPSKRGIPVIVDGVQYNSCNDAEKALGLPPCVIARTLRENRTKYNGHSVERAPRGINSTRKIGVICTTTGETWDSISGASRAIGCDDWTMSKKMESSGYFIDLYGRTYKRLKPMSTTKTYKDTGAKLSRLVVKGIPRPSARKTPVLETKPFEVVKDIIEKPVEKKTVPAVVRDAINEKIVSMLKEKGIYDEIVELLNYGGFSSVKIKND